jgi:hypothetical protein
MTHHLAECKATCPAKLQSLLWSAFDAAAWMCARNPDPSTLQVSYGNEDTFREMLRIKRSVAASFSQLHFNTAIIDSATGPSSSGAACAYRHREGVRRSSCMPCTGVHSMYWLW